MKIADKIEGYESMSAEERLAALEAYEVDEKDDSKLKEALNKATAEASKYKKELREKQTEAERLEAERKEENERRDAELQELRKRNTIAEHKANFLKEGYSEELADTSATALAEGDFQTLFSNLKTFLTEKEKALKEELLKKTPAPTKSGVTTSITKEQFEKMSITEKSKLFEENRELYDSLIGKGD